MAPGSDAPGAQIEALLETLRGELAAESFGRVAALLREVLALHAEGLSRAGRILAELGEAGADARRRLLDEPAFAALLTLHDLHPEPLRARVERGLERVRPKLAEHAGGAVLVDVDEAAGVVRLRLEGTCDGCPASQLTLQGLIEQAVRAEAPEIARVEVEPPSGPLRQHPPTPGESKAARGPAPLVARAATAPEHRGAERCGLCGAPLGERHPHLVDLEHRRLACACTPCSLLLERDGSGGSRFRTLPDRRRRIATLRAGSGLWERLGIPVRLAFFFHNSELGRPVCFYPSPAGPTESEVSLPAWGELVAANPPLADLEPDVEAALLHEPEPGRSECFLVPIDACYALTGLVRRHWRGFAGGERAWQEIGAFLDGLRARARDVELERGDAA